MNAVLITSSILIFLIAALRPILRGKIDPRLQYALWLAVVVRLLIPVNFVDSAYSVLALLNRAQEPSQIVEAIGQTPIPAQSYDSARAQVVEEYRQQGIEEAALTPSDLMAIDRQAKELMRGPTLAELAAKYARAVWLGGAAAMGLWFLLVNLRLRRLLRGARPLRGVDCPLPVYVSGALSSPCLCGRIRSAIYVTPAALESPERLRHVLAHELTHYRHRDHWWALVRCLCLCLYWFDPLVWWAAALSRQDCELACDEGAIRRLGEGERLSYGRTLVDMIAAGRTPLLQTATTMAGGRRRVRERIRLIARKPRTLIVTALALVVVLGLALGCTFTGAPEGTQPPEDSNAPELSAGALQVRLLGIPGELKNDVTASTIQEEPTCLAVYWMNREWIGLGEGLGWLLSVEQLSQAEFEEHIGQDNSGWECFARSGDTYYAIASPTDVRWYTPDDAEPYYSAYDAIRDFAMQTVLDTEGVEPFDAGEALYGDNLTEGATYTKVAYWPYKSVNGNTDIVWMIRLVQPARQGEGGVWIPEQLQVFDNEHGVSPEPQRIKPETGGLTIAGYGQQLQAQADAGEAGWATDPIEVCRRVAEGEFAHSNAPVDSFTQDPAYIQDFLAQWEASTAQQAIQAAVDRLMAAPSVEFTLHPAGTDYVCQYSAVPSEDFWAYYLQDLPTMFHWESAGYSTSEGSTSLRLASADGSVSLFFSEGSYLMLVERDGKSVCYKGWYAYGGLDGGDPYSYMRNWYDQVEIDTLRVNFVPDRGQSHENVVKEWIEGYEGAMAKCSPGSPYTCTYVRIGDAKADQPEGLTAAELDEFAQRQGLSAEDFKKTWFGFRYSLIFVPESGSAESFLWAGNTYEYDGAGEDAPEGALIYTRQGFMQLVDGNWVCFNVGTGW